VSLRPGVVAHDVTGSGPTGTARARPAPALLLVHAGIADRRMWDDQVEPFADAGWTVVRADLPGFGETAPPARPVGLWAVLRDLLDHLGVERAVVAGCSLGGRAAVDLALAAPDRVRALVLVGSGLAGHRFEEPALLELWERSETALERGDHLEAARVETDTWVVGVGRDPEAVDPEVRRKVQDMLLVAYGHGEVDLEEPGPPAAGRLGELAVPTLVVVGEHDRPDIHAIADALAAGIGGAERVVLPGTGHLPSMERPADFNRVVLEFLARLEGPPRAG
jgi:pimeloyl-ACP methyl ester carboxylesterase